MIFISFEGIEKVGKTTNIKYVADFLLGKKCKLKVTREPGGTQIGESIRKILLDNKKHNNMNALTELFLLYAARFQHIDQIIIPSLIGRKIIICDRFIDSTYAYQSGGRNISIKKIKVIEKLFFYNIKPDFVFLLNYPTKKSLLYIKKHENCDRIEKEKIDFFIKVKKIYIKRAILNKNKYFIINCNNNIFNVQKVIKKILEDIKLI